jgi:predicted nucleic acid-binding protein
MTTALDTNVVIALWDRSPVLSGAAKRALDTALARGPLVAAAPVFAELMAAPGRDVAFLDEFVRSTNVRVDWDLNERVWRAAGRAFQAYSSRRQRARKVRPRRILADFVIGAHAAVNGFRLLTFDSGIYEAAFPGLVIDRL